MLVINIVLVYMFLFIYFGLVSIQHTRNGIDYMEEWINIMYRSFMLHVNIVPEKEIGKWNISS